MRRSLWASVALGLASTAISLVLAELVYRAVLEARYRTRVAGFTSETWELLPGDPRVFRLPASHVGRVKMLWADEYAPYRTNADGLRDAPRGERRAGVARVLVFGDSYTFGWGVADSEPYPQRAEALLRADGLAVEVINAGVPGYNTEQEALLLAALLPRHRPDMVVLGYVVNDAEPQNNVPQPPGATYRWALSWAWEDAREQVMRRLAGSPSWSSPRKWEVSFSYLMGFRAGSRKWRASRDAFLRIAAECRNAGVPLVVMTLPDVTQELDDRYPFGPIHDAVAEWSREAGVECEDVMRVVRGRDHRQLWIPTDGHPNAAAHDLFAGVLRDAIVAGLRIRP
jgi:hypothetical protein